jgi:phosphatidylinositol 4-kinase
MVCQSATVRIQSHQRLISNEDRWSFGGNRLQIKAETHVLADVQAQLDVIGKLTTADIGSKLKAKQDLLSLLIANEQTRLMVWLFPLDYGKKHYFTSGSHKHILPDVRLSPLPADAY